MMIVVLSAGSIAATDHLASIAMPSEYRTVDQTTERCSQANLYVKQTKNSSERWTIRRGATGFVSFSGGINTFYWDCGSPPTNDHSSSDMTFTAVFIHFRSGDYREVDVAFLRKK
jgi:hypothetical protein